tara:strand:+ start:550 stop:987 length:438 start_codon:yes stop_codon:yes gene_type:complete
MIKPYRNSNMEQKNFVVSFINNNDNTNTVLTGFNRQIMEIMIAINNSANYQEAQHNKINTIREFVEANKKDIEYLIYIYSIELALGKYINKFKMFNSNSTILITDLAILIIDEIICIYEIQVKEIKRERSESLDSDLQFNLESRE